MTLAQLNEHLDAVQQLARTQPGVYVLHAFQYEPDADGIAIRGDE